MVPIWVLSVLILLPCYIKQSDGLNFCSGTETSYGVSLVYSRTRGVTRCSCRLRVEDWAAPLLNYTVRVGHVRTELDEGGGFYNLSLTTGNLTRSIINVTLPERMLILQAPQSMESRVTLDTGHQATSPTDFRLRIFSGSKRTNITVTCSTLSDGRPPGSVSSSSNPTMSILSTVSSGATQTPTPDSVNVPSTTSLTTTSTPDHDAVSHKNGGVSKGTMAGLCIGTIVLSSGVVLAMIIYRRRKLQALRDKPLPPLPQQPIDTQCCRSGHVSYINVIVRGLSPNDSTYYNVETKDNGQIYENVDAHVEDEYDLACSAFSPDEPCYAEIPALKAREKLPSTPTPYHDDPSNIHEMHNIYLNVANRRCIVDEIVEIRNDMAAKGYRPTVKSAEETTGKLKSSSKKHMDKPNKLVISSENNTITDNTLNGSCSSTSSSFDDEPCTNCSTDISIKPSDNLNKQDDSSNMFDEISTVSSET